MDSGFGKSVDFLRYVIFSWKEIVGTNEEENSFWIYQVDQNWQNDINKNKAISLVKIK